MLRLVTHPAGLTSADGCAESFAHNHASQCGFCTPGFVVACHAALSQSREAGRPVSAATLNQALDGNLCRCTGYRPIVDSCQVRPHTACLLPGGCLPPVWEACV